MPEPCPSVQGTVRGRYWERTGATGLASPERLGRFYLPGLLAKGAGRGRSAAAFGRYRAPAGAAAAAVLAPDGRSAVVGEGRPGMPAPACGTFAPHDRGKIGCQPAHGDRAYPEYLCQAERSQSCRARRQSPFQVKMSSACNVSSRNFLRTCGITAKQLDQ